MQAQAKRAVHNPTTARTNDDTQVHYFHSLIRRRNLLSGLSSPPTSAPSLQLISARFFLLRSGTRYSPTIIISPLCGCRLSPRRCSTILAPTLSERRSDRLLVLKNPTTCTSHGWRLSVPTPTGSARSAFSLEGTDAFVSHPSPGL